MATFFFTLRGDQIGTFTSFSGAGNNADRVVTVNGVEAIGTPDQLFTIRIDQAASNETQFRNGQRITLLDSEGNLVLNSNGTPFLNNGGVQPDIEQGLGAGDEHLIIPEGPIIIQLAGVSGTPNAPETVTISAADQSATAGVGDDDGNLDFADTTSTFSTTFPCFALGTRIDTPDGPRACETLGVGDLVSTTTGTDRLIWVGQRILFFPNGPHPEHPILIKQHSLGQGSPMRDTMISPQHKLLIRGAAVHKLFQCEAVLAPAKGLVSLLGFRSMNGKRTVTYVSLLFAQHRVLFAEGAEMESFYPGPYIMRAIGPRLRSEICQALPAYDPVTHTGYGDHACRSLTVREAEMLVNEILLNPDWDTQELRLGT